MNCRRLWWFVAVLALAPALAGLGADRDAYGDPLPEGAKARLGTARLRVRTPPTPVLAPDGKSLFVQSNFGLLRLDPATGAPLSKTAVQLFGVSPVLSADGKRAAIVNSNGVAVIEIASGKALARIERRLPANDAAALSADGNILVLGGAGDGIKKGSVSILVWDVAADKEIAKFDAPQNEYGSVAISANGKVVATWGLFLDPNAPPEPDKDPSRFVVFWDAATGKVQAKFRVAGFAPSRVCFSPDGALAAVAGNNSTIDLVDTKTGASKHLLLGRSRMGRALAFSADGTTLAAAADDGAVQRWKVADGARLSTTEPPGGPVLEPGVRAVSADKAVAWGMRGTAAIVWEVPSGKLISPEGGHTAAVASVAVTPDGRHALTSAVDGIALKWDIATGKSVGVVPLHAPNFGFGSPPAPAALSPDTLRALVREANGVGVHDLASGAQQYVIPTPLEGWSVAAFSPEGARIVVTTSHFNNPKKAPGLVSVWDAAACKRLVSIELPEYSLVSAAVTPDGKHVVTAGHKGASSFIVTAWEVPTGAKKGEFAEESGMRPPLVATAPDNKTAAVVTTKGRLISFDLATGKTSKAYELNGLNPSLAPVFSPNGRWLAVTGLVDASPFVPVRVLDWPSGTIKYTFNVPGGLPGGMVFSPDSKSLVTGVPDTTALVWDVSK